MGKDRNQFSNFLSGITLGAGLMYFFDPARGARRRGLLRDQLHSLGRQSADGVRGALQDASGHMKGICAETRAALRTDEAVPDVKLVERVRSKLGRVTSHPRAIRVAAREGRIVLSGPILASEVEAVIACVSHVRGVHGVENQLEIHEQPGSHPSLQTGERRAGQRTERLQSRWSPGTRLLVTILGGRVFLGGLRSPSFGGGLRTLVGLGMCSRAITNREVGKLLGGGVRGAIDLHKTINVNRPVEEVFAFWSNFENFPRFMRHLREVRILGEDRSHWRAVGPAGFTTEWTAVITKLEPNRTIAWKSEEGAQLPNSGIVAFRSNEKGGTQVDIRLSYNPPGGALGHLIASLFGSDPKHAMDEDLVQFKSLMESGRTGLEGDVVRRDEIELPH